jgi:RTX calcium-binding nonapeptide repeat (4 copies)
MARTILNIGLTDAAEKARPDNGRAQIVFGRSLGSPRSSLAVARAPWLARLSARSLVGLAACLLSMLVLDPGSSSAVPSTLTTQRCGNTTPASGPHRQAACGDTARTSHTTASPHNLPKRHTKLKPAGATVALGATGDCGVGSLATWMAALAPCLQDRKLGQIVIPQSHDSATSGVDYPTALVSYAQAQDKDLTDQLNGGIRALDVRVEYSNQLPPCSSRPCAPTRPDYYAHHGGGSLDVFDDTLTLAGILTEIEQWALAPGHGHEIILLNLEISQSDGAAFPTGDCQSFGQALGSALVTPSQLQSSFGTTDPSQVTLSQLWSLPDPQGAARVLMNNDQCMDAADPSAGQWSTWSSSYYANQCTANGENPPADQSSGFQSLDLGAAHRRATGAGTWGPAAVGGFYELDIQGTPEADCLVSPLSMLADDKQVLAALYSQWQSDPATMQNLNVVAEDFFEQTDLVKDVLAMDGALFGPFSGAPTAFVDSSGNYQVFVATGAGLNHYEKKPGGIWTGEVIASGSPFTTEPAALEDSSGNLHVFETTGGGLNHYEKKSGGIWTGEEITSGTGQTTPPAAFVDSSGNLHVFVTVGGGLNHYEKKPGAIWTGEEIASGTGATGRPAAFEDSSGNYNVYVVTGGALEHFEKKPPSGPWGGEIITSGSPFTAGPAAFQDSSGNYNVFETTGGGLNHYEKATLGNWGGEEIASGTGDTDRPAAFVDSSGNYNVFVTTGAGLIHYERPPGGSWGGEVIDGSDGPFSSPAAFVDASGNYNVFVTTGAGLNQYEKTPDGTWTGTILAGVFKASACFGRGPTIAGDTGSDRLPGTPRGDVIVGRSGNDRISAGAGSDAVCAGPGNDRVSGGPGNDRISGGSGNDILFGGPGRDVLYGGPGNDRLFGGPGNDRIYGGPGNDRIYGGPGNDRIYGGPGNDRIYGGPGSDRIYGGPGDDTIDVRGGGRDYVDCGGGRDTVRADKRDILRNCEHVIRR